TGRGGCNNIGGTYVKKRKNLTISQLLSTKMFCEDAMKWESMYLQQLEKSQSYSINGETLEINCGDSGNLIFRLNWKKPNWE
ncbi:MAG: META domain-containing protein, partial [Saprospiraceae bacterium]|nr:META domain-containing protein [Saprospiraceae bacterium]